MLEAVKIGNMDDSIDGVAGSMHDRENALASSGACLLKRAYWTATYSWILMKSLCWASSNTCICYKDTPVLELLLPVRSEPVG